jgi:hypothetical protein
VFFDFSRARIAGQQQIAGLPAFAKDFLQTLG